MKILLLNTLKLVNIDLFLQFRRLAFNSNLKKKHLTFFQKMSLLCL